jgi:hypothetical protein
VRPLFLGLVASCLAIGCGGVRSLGENTNGAGHGSGGAERGVEGSSGAAFAVTRCGADELAVSGACVPMSGSTWLLTTHMPEGTRVFEIDLHPGGRCTSHDPNDTTPDDDEWAMESKGLRFWFNHRYVVYEAELDDARAMHGVTHNVNDLSWSWSAVRVR